MARIITISICVNSRSTFSRGENEDEDEWGTLTGGMRPAANPPPVVS